MISLVERGTAYTTTHVIGTLFLFEMEVLNAATKQEKDNNNHDAENRGTSVTQYAGPHRAILLEKKNNVDELCNVA